MLLLDTDAVSIFLNDAASLHSTLQQRLARPGSPAYATSVVSYQEEVKGWLGAINRAKTPGQLLSAYKSLHGMQGGFRRLRILPFDAAAQALFEQFRRQKLRTPTMDLRIACVAL